MLMLAVGIMWSLTQREALNAFLYFAFLAGCGFIWFILLLLASTDRPR